MGKRALIAKLLQDIRASYWFLPTVLAVSAVLLAQVTQYIDHTYTIMPDSWRKTQVAGARSTLALVSQSMIGVAGVMFSMTIVAVSFASGNFGPRLIGNFMRDRGTQWSLGILIATFVYTLLILRAVQSPFGPESNSDAFVPHLSMLIALGLTGISILAMIYYVHHIPEIINVSNISANLGDRLRLALEARISEQEDTIEGEGLAFPTRAPDHRINLTGNGYVQTWNREQLLKLAKKHELFVDLRQEAGSFITSATPVLDVWVKSEMSDDLRSALRDCFAIGSIPTEPQNMIFILDQLTEMVARALSPGVNDPFTAINCLNWIYASLLTAANFEGGLKPLRVGRVRYGTLDFETLLTAGVIKPLPYITADPLALAHLIELLKRLCTETENQEVHTLVKALLEQCSDTSDTKTS